MRKENDTCFNTSPCSSCSECKNCTKSKLKETEISRFLRHNPNYTKETADANYIEWWLKHRPFVSYVSKYQSASDFMNRMNDILAIEGINMLGYIQDFNYYKKFWGEAETCKKFIKEAINAVEFLGKNVGISQNNNEVIIMLKDNA
ncbi:MAG: hypothetical protein UHN47_07215 [Lachnospiraceae bacterium]|nr:hypothetical protein [Lachnospiraceae bacterium]